MHSPQHTELQARPELDDREVLNTVHPPASSPSQPPILSSHLMSHIEFPVLVVSSLLFLLPEQWTRQPEFQSRLTHWFTMQCELYLYLLWWSDVRFLISPLQHHKVRVGHTWSLSFSQHLRVHILRGEESHHTEPGVKEQNKAFPAHQTERLQVETSHFLRLYFIYHEIQDSNMCLW